MEYITGGDPNGDGNNSDDDPLSREIADGLLDNFLKQGAHQGSADRRDFNGSWSKDNFVDGAGYHLGIY
ncbi:MAG: hypothetical protein HC773_25065 [Scytonema sp. CRU_2_7]|nr:hypothetical protein [Scytonema sp. CRU_2_7]